MCDVFAVHSVIAKYGQQYLDEGVTTGICKDNLEECVAQAKNLIDHVGFVAFVCQIAGVSTSEVRKAFSGHDRDFLGNLLLAKLPKVKFTKIPEPYHSFQTLTIDYSTIDLRDLSNASPMGTLSNAV